MMVYFTVASAYSMRRSQNSVIFFGGLRLFSARVLLIALF